MARTVSLVIGTRNPKKEWIEDALKSAEGLFDETIIVDDGSNLPVEGATVRHAEPLGFYMARNTGIAAAKGEIIASLDDDDIFLRENVKKLRQFVEDVDADIYHFPIEMFGDIYGQWGKEYALERILDANQIPSGSWFTKKTWKELNGFQYPLAEDWDFWARACKKKMRFQYFPYAVYLHRMRKDSISAGWTGQKFVEIKKEIKQRYEKT